MSPVKHILPGSEEHRRYLARLARRHTAPPADDADDREQVASDREQERDPGEPDPRPDMPGHERSGKRGKSRPRSKSSELQEQDVRRYLAMMCRWLERQPGREHWHRDEDELVLVTVPATRLYNRLNAELRARLLELSDPAALCIGVVMVFGPAISQEVMRFRWRSRPAPVPAPRPAPLAVAANGRGAVSADSPVAPDPAARPADIPPLGI